MSLSTSMPKTLVSVARRTISAAFEGPRPLPPMRTTWVQSGVWAWSVVSGKMVAHAIAMPRNKAHHESARVPTRQAEACATNPVTGYRLELAADDDLDLAGVPAAGQAGDLTEAARTIAVVGAIEASDVESVERFHANLDSG